MGSDSVASHFDFRTKIILWARLVAGWEGAADGEAACYHLATCLRGRLCSVRCPTFGDHRRVVVGLAERYLFEEPGGDYAHSEEHSAYEEGGLDARVEGGFHRIGHHADKLVNEVGGDAVRDELRLKLREAVGAGQHLRVSVAQPRQEGLGRGHIRLGRCGQTCLEGFVFLGEGGREAVMEHSVHHAAEDRHADRASDGPEELERGCHHADTRHGEGVLHDQGVEGEGDAHAEAEEHHVGDCHPPLRVHAHRPHQGHTDRDEDHADDANHAVLARARYKLAGEDAGEDYRDHHGGESVAAVGGAVTLDCLDKEGDVEGRTEQPHSGHEDCKNGGGKDAVLEEVERDDRLLCHPRLDEDERGQEDGSSREEPEYLTRTPVPAGSAAQ